MNQSAHLHQCVCSKEVAAALKTPQAFSATLLFFTQAKTVCLFLLGGWIDAVFADPFCSSQESENPLNLAEHFGSLPNDERLRRTAEERRSKAENMALERVLSHTSRVSCLVAEQP